MLTHIATGAALLAGALLISAVLAVVAFDIDTIAGSRPWIFGLTMFVNVENLILDISQHRSEAERTITGGRTTIDERVLK